MTDDLIAFLKARLDEDEEAAKASQDGKSGRWEIDYAEGTGIDGFVGEVVHGEFYVAHIGRNRYDLGNLLEVDARHIVRWDPARALAEVAAKRRVIGLHSDGGSSQGYTESGYDVMEHACETCGAFGEYGVPWPCETLRVLVLPYASHPDYRAEWAPDKEVDRG